MTHNRQGALAHLLPDMHSKGLYGILYQFRTGDGEELIQIWEYARDKYGADSLTGKVFGRPPTIKGVEEDPSVPAHCWLFELKQAEPAI
jgi:hypothetical protein